jgi:autoinducer 2-degrading protein
MNEFAILVTCRVKPGTVEEFIPLIEANASAARREEEHCKVFAVNQSVEDPQLFQFYEVYTDAEGLEIHKQQPHYLAFQEAAGPLIEALTVEPLSVLQR